MTIKEALETIERLYPNKNTIGDKLVWLSELDSTVVTNLVRRHHNPISEEFETDGESVTYTLANSYDAINRMYLRVADGSNRCGYTWTYNKDTKVITYTTAPEKGTMTVCGERLTYDTNYDENTAPSTELLIPKPFDQAYIYWLQSKIDYFNGEIARFNNSSAMYNSLYSDFAAWYTRTHKPFESGWKYL